MPGAATTTRDVHVLATLLALIDEAGGELAASQVMPKLCDEKKTAVRVAGGLKQFCTKYCELEFRTSICADGHVCRQDVSARAVVDVVLALIEVAGGRLSASRIIPEVSKHGLGFKSVINRAGGPKKFCKQHEELEFVTSVGCDGWVQRRVVKMTRLYHATCRAAAESIKQEGRFRCGERGFAGGAIYFSGEQHAACRKLRDTPDVVITCDVDLGLMTEAKRYDMDKDKCEASGFNSVKICALDVYAVYDPHRIQIVRFTDLQQEQVQLEGTTRQQEQLRHQEEQRQQEVERQLQRKRQQEEAERHACKSYQFCQLQQKHQQQQEDMTRRAQKRQQGHVRHQEAARTVTTRCDKCNLM